MQAASLIAAGARPRDVRAILDQYPSLDAYAGDSAETHAASGVVSVVPVRVDLGAVWAVALGEPGYPAQLAAISAPPPVLYGLGDRGALRAGVAVVGTRDITDLGATIASVAVASAAEADVVVTSGLALGVDAAAHSAALDAGVVTVAVLATHPDTPTPRANAALAARIVAAGGAVVSEQPPGVTAPNGPALMARNRLITGLSFATVVCEAGLKSGTMGAVRDTITQGRTLIVPVPRPGHRDRPGAQGLLALTNPAGCDPSLIGATGKLAGTVAERVPVADGVATTRAALRDYVVTAAAFSPWPTGPET